MQSLLSICRYWRASSCWAKMASLPVYLILLSKKIWNELSTEQYGSENIDTQVVEEITSEAIASIKAIDSTYQWEVSNASRLDASSKGTKLLLLQPLNDRRKYTSLSLWLFHVGVSLAPWSSKIISKAVQPLKQITIWNLIMLQLI